VVKDKEGNVTELHCTYDPATRGGDAPDGRKVKGTIHWVSAPHAYSAEVRLYDHLFKAEFPDDAPTGRTFLDNINPDSLAVVPDAKLEPSLVDAPPGTHYQFERLGYFFTDPVDSAPDRPIFNRTVTLRDTWAKEAARG
jgi:glutaminyl-tRNA synthetase